MTTAYDFSVKTTADDTFSLNDYQGKVSLIVNTASKCGLAPQFEGLQGLYDTYKDEGFVVLAFPSDQFNQEYDDMEETVQFCQTMYDVSFPMFNKIKVNGENEHPLYTHLKEKETGVLTKKIKWNFTKFLVDQNGHVINRYAPTTDPENIAEDIEALLDN